MGRGGTVESKCVGQRFIHLQQTNKGRDWATALVSEGRRGASCMLHSLSRTNARFVSRGAQRTVLLDTESKPVWVPFGLTYLFLFTLVAHTVLKTQNRLLSSQIPRVLGSLGGAYHTRPPLSACLGLPLLHLQVHQYPPSALQSLWRMRSKSRLA